MKEDSPGTTPAAKLVKAGCGFRYDPDTLSADTGFDFEGAKALLAQTQSAAEANHANERADQVSDLLDQEKPTPDGN